jgi:hypothetical protein
MEPHAFCGVILGGAGMKSHRLTAHPSRLPNITKYSSSGNSPAAGLLHRVKTEYPFPITLHWTSRRDLHAPPAHHPEFSSIFRQNSSILHPKRSRQAMLNTPMWGFVGVLSLSAPQKTSETGQLRLKLAPKQAQTHTKTAPLPALFGKTSFLCLPRQAARPILCPLIMPL